MFYRYEFIPRYVACPRIADIKSFPRSASCPKIEEPGQFLNFQQIIRSLHQTIVEDVADLTPTGFVGDQVRSYICPGMHICEALFKDQYVLKDVGYLGNWLTDIVDLPGRHLPDGTADMVKYKLGEYN